MSDRHACARSALILSCRHGLKGSTPVLGYVCERCRAAAPVALTAAEIRAVATRLRAERKKLEEKLKDPTSYGFTDHDWIATKAEADGMLYASAVYLEALVAKEEAEEKRRAAHP